LGNWKGILQSQTDSDLELNFVDPQFDYSTMMVMFLPHLVGFSAGSSRNCGQIFVKFLEGQAL